MLFVKKLEDKRFLSEIKKKIIFPQNKFSKCGKIVFQQIFPKCGEYFFSTKILPKCGKMFLHCNLSM